MEVLKTISELYQGITPEPRHFFHVLDICSQQREVREQVLKNHDNNMWWPNEVLDWRIRMLVAGLSTRVGYAMIKSYQGVVTSLNSYSYEVLNQMSDLEFLSLVKPIGLGQSRLAFKKSLFTFIDSFENENKKIETFSNSELIKTLEKNVKGAGFKVAQCCVLYAKGYHSGIMPVDSGMKDMLGPCLGFSYKNNPFAHEIFRQSLEYLVEKVDCKSIIVKNGYESLTIPDSECLSWWAHLVLIYYKRAFCNRRMHLNCPLKPLGIGQACNKEKPTPGGTRLVIIEGVDGVGKTTMANYYSSFGYKRRHFEHNRDVINLKDFYKLALSQIASPVVLDRSFISEYAYGNAIRKNSRINLNDINEILQTTKELNPLFIYVTCDKTQLITRDLDKSDLDIINSNYNELTFFYEKVFTNLSSQFPVLKVDTTNEETVDFGSRIWKT